MANFLHSHHYIISFDPADVTDFGLTGEKAQTLCLELTQKTFPRHQALIVTHTDGNNGSGNVHTHIVINSIRKYTVEREEYMAQPHDHEAGFNHRSTNLFLQHLQKEVMAMCEREGLHQVDLLSPAAKKITQEEYNISVIESRGRYRYLHPERNKRTTDKALGSHYGKEYLSQVFGISEQLDSTDIHKSKPVSVVDYHRDPILILYYKSNLRLVVDLQTNVKAMQNQAYAQK